ncbi:hypothetical protein [Fictibacillus terranigra]|uniref:Cell division protein FtsL n=1 Tax=Fictibacillus terranigra TaxID=3058424 RepID=A0ABT8EC59_9BACL|nr:hypothetical protein [Fictibacillus sp. CENA-BCM004]MDN4075512.1 hypothetical protein [Fictibacillus sp. CENA-BCM004]
MEPSQKKNHIMFMGVFIVAVIIVMYVFSLRSQLQEVRANQSHYEEQIKSLTSVQQNEALSKNRAVL